MKRTYKDYELLDKDYLIARILVLEESERQHDKSMKGVFLKEQPSYLKMDILPTEYTCDYELNNLKKSIALDMHYIKEDTEDLRTVYVKKKIQLEVIEELLNKGVAI